jgi:hypothetical protein
MYFLLFCPFLHSLTWFLVYSMAQASKAIIPKDAGGPLGKRIGVSVAGQALRVGAYVTERVSLSEWPRYSIVVLNCEWITCIGMLGK